MYPHIEISGKSISTYFILSVIGIIAVCIMMLARCKPKNFITTKSDAFYTLMMIIIFTVLGSKLFQVTGLIIINGSKPEFWTAENWKEILSSGVGVFYGGLFGGVFGAFLYSKIFRTDFIEFCDLFAPEIPFFHFFGRIGCFMAGCCYGKPSEFGIAYTISETAPNGVALIPVQLIEAFGNLLIMAFLIKLKPEKKARGSALFVYGICYSVLRFATEFLRGDIHRGIYILSTSQWISILVFIVCTAVTAAMFRRARLERELIFEDSTAENNDTAGEQN